MHILTCGERRYTMPVTSTARSAATRSPCAFPAVSVTSSSTMPIGTIFIVIGRRYQCVSQLEPARSDTVRPESKLNMPVQALNGPMKGLMLICVDCSRAADAICQPCHPAGARVCEVCCPNQFIKCAQNDSKLHSPMHSGHILHSFIRHFTAGPDLHVHVHREALEELLAAA